MKTRVYQIDPQRVVKLTESGRKNARYMTGEQERRLSANIAGDGALTSVPLLYNPKRQLEDPEDLDPVDLIVVSGNHRIDAAITAGLNPIWVMEVVSYLAEPEIVALQLAHNAITGQDDPNILLELYSQLDLDLKKYTGLTDEDFKLPELNLTGMAFAAPSYQEISLLFLPDEAEEFKRIMQEIEKKGRENEFLLAKYRDFDMFFQTLCRVKETLKVFNNAVAMRLLCDLASDHLDLLEAQAEQSEAQAEKEAAAPIVESVAA